MSMRATAKKIKIEDLAKGEYNHTPEGEPNYLTTPWDQKVLRVNIIATVIDKFVRDDGGYGTLHLDDGSETIRAKAWSEDVAELEKYSVGDIVRVIGKVREYEGEIHLVPEIIKKIEDPNWELVHKMEVLKNRKELYEQGIEPEIEEEEEESEMKTEEIEIQPASSEKKSDRIGGIEELGSNAEIEDEEQPQISDEKKDKLLLALDKLEGEDGATVSDLAAEIDESISKTEEIIGVLLNEDKIYEPIAGQYKRLV